MVRFLHTADWQIGKQFSNIEGDASAFLRNQRIETIKRIGELATEREADAVLVAGDVFDGTAVKGETILKTFKAMGDSFGGKWLLLPGNHDPSEKGGLWERIKKILLSDNVHVLDEPSPFLLKDLHTVVLPAPLKRKHDIRDLTNWFDHDEYRDRQDLIRIGLAHGSVDNRLQRGEALNTISDTRVESAGLSYLALGDWHGTLYIGKRTWYSGTPEPDRFKDNDAGNVLLIDIESPSAEPQVEKLPIGHYMWCQLERPLFNLADLDAVELELKKSGHPLDRTLLKLILKGVISLDTRSQLKNALEHLHANLFHLEADETNLVAQPDEKDLAQLEQTGFVLAAANKLKRLAEDAAGPEGDAARLALEILYLEHKSLSN